MHITELIHINIKLIIRTSLALLETSCSVSQSLDEFMMSFMLIIKVKFPLQILREHHSEFEIVLMFH